MNFGHAVAYYTFFPQKILHSGEFLLFETNYIPDLTDMYNVADRYYAIGSGIRAKKKRRLR